MENEVEVELYKIKESGPIKITYVDYGVEAGFPSPALDFFMGEIDLNKILIQHPSATYMGKVQGNSMKNARIFDKDRMIVDRDIKPQSGMIAVCRLEGKFTLKRLKVEKDVIWLIPENEDYKPIKVTEDDDFTVWGIVTCTFRNLVETRWLD